MNRVIYALVLFCFGVAECLAGGTIDGSIRGLAKPEGGFGLGSIELSDFFFIQPDTRKEDWPSKDDPIKVGQRVLVIYRKDADKFIATCVQLLSYNDGSVGSRAVQSATLNDGEYAVEGVVGSANIGQDKKISAISVGWSFHINEETEIVGKDSIAALRLGDPVSIRYIISGTRNVAKRVTVGEPLPETAQ